MNKFAVFTPSHHFRHIERAGYSLAHAVEELGAETDWVIARNGAATHEQLNPALVKRLSEARARVVFAPDYQGPFGSVGALKRHACEHAIKQGATHLLELDHDDELTASSLWRLRDAFEAGADFVFSFAGETVAYSPQHGWESFTEVVNGRRCRVNATPEVCARSLFEIFYAPNHVRAWTVEAYKRAGGHDETLPVADDHDLLCRTYLSGARMERLPLALYVQHQSPEQTQVKRNAEIQTAQRAVGKKYLYALAQEQARREKLRLIDLGGAHGAPEGFEVVDKLDPANPIDVRNGLPFPTSSVGVVRAHDFLEHVPPQDVVPLMNELHRVLAPGGWLLTSTPSTDGRGAFQDPTHVSFWNSNSWWYYSREEQARYVPGFTGRFQVASVENSYPTDWHKFHEIIYCDAALWCLKGQPQIGEVFI